MVVEGILQLSSMHLVDDTKIVLHISDLLDSDQYVYALVTICVKAMDVNGCAYIVVTALADLELVALLQILV